MTRARLALLALVLAPGCYAAHERAAADAPREPDASRADARATDGGVDATAALACGATGPTTAMPCTAVVRFPVLTLSAPMCFVDVRLEEGEAGTLRWDCAGGGAELVFESGARFGGTVVDGALTLCRATSYDHSCHWVSTQRFVGDLETGTLAYTYEETTPAGPCPDAFACGATGATTLRR
jgi:hypothetical protein